MARLTVQFAGRPPYDVRVIDVAPRPGAPRVDRGLLRLGAGDEESEVTLDLPAGRYQLRLSAANAVEQRWVDLSEPGARIFSDPPDEGPTTWRGALNVRSQRRRRGDGFISQRAVGVLLRREGAVDDAFLGGLGFRRVQGEPDAQQVALDGFIVLHERPIDRLNSPALAQLRAHPAVAAAGPLHQEGAAFSLLRAHLYVQFRSGVAPDIAVGILARLRGRGVKALASAPRTYRVDFPLSLGFAINGYVAALVADHRVAFAEPGFGDRPVLHAPPADFLWPMLWDRHLLDLEAALDVAGAGAAVQVAVIDDAFTGVVEHPELLVSSAPSDTGNNHGMACMGLIAAVADTDGLIGVAPDSQLVPIVFASTGTLADSLANAAAADVISSSLGMTTYMTGVDEAALFGSTRLRGGRGIAQFFSAGNGSTVSLLSASFGSSEFGFATSGVSQGGLKLADGNAGSQMAWCTPAGNTGTFPTNWATSAPDLGTLPAEETWSLTVLQLDASNPSRCQVAGPVPVIFHGFVIPANPTGASLPARIIAADDVLAWTAAGAGWIELDASVTVSVGDALVLGARRLGTVQTNTFSGSSIPVDWHVPLADVGDAVWIAHEVQVPLTRYSLDAGTGAAAGLANLAAPLDGAVFQGQAVFAMVQHARSFGASSAANALAAGVGALVLRANPELTWRELEEVLKSTAVPVGAQIDLGAGRLNAFEAVNAALAYMDDRADLHIRDSMGDRGDKATAPMSPSPDIWVRQAAGPGPAVTYGEPGPHEDPIAAQTNYVYVRVHNRGSRPSPAARVLLRVAASSLAPFDWPTAWTAGDTATTQTIGEAYDLIALAPGAEAIVEFVWPASEMLVGKAEAWLLAEVTPQDGALAEPEVHRNTNLAIRPVSVIDSDGVGPQVIWRDALDQPLGFSTRPSPPSLTVRAHMPDGPVAYAAFRAHGRRRADDLPETIVFSTPTWIAAADAYEFSIPVPGTWAEMILEAEVIDSLGRVAPSDQRLHRLAVRLPIELTLLLDYSGSMSASAGTESKWSAARRAATLFEHLFDELSNGDTFKVHSFFHTAGATQTLGTTAADLPLANPPGGNMTPLGDPILTAAAGFTPGGAGERVIVLLTDGKENRGATLAEIRADAPGNPVSVTDDATGGVRIHACAFGAPGAVDTDALEGLVHGGDDPALRAYAGRLQTTETLSEPDAAGALTEMFLSVLSDVTGTEMIGPLNAANNTFVVEPGVDMFLLVAPAGPATLTLTGPGAATVTDVEGSRQFKVTGNTAGTWTLNGAPATDCFVLVDLQLTSELAVAPTFDGGFDCAITLLFAGQPITDARCELRARGPGEAIGEAILNARVRLRPQRRGDKSTREQLLAGALKRRGQALRIANNVHVLQPTGAGRFAMTLEGPLRTGTWSFELRVTGRTPSGAPFERLVRASRVIAARPNAATSVVEWGALASGRQQVVLTPKDARGDRLGPGLTLTTMANGVTHALADRGDGTYAAVLDARTPLRLSKRLGSREVAVPRPRLFAVKVSVTRVRIGASHDGRGAGEWVFTARTQLGKRRKSTRLPQRGVLSLRPNTDVAADAVLVDGRVLEGEGLTLRLSAFELDGRAQWLKTLRSTGPGVTQLGTEGLRLTGDPRRWVGVHRVGNRGWHVELRVEVEG